VTDLPIPDPSSLTELLAAAQHGDTAAQELVARRVYAELHQLADIYLGRERADHTLQPTALVNEAYLRLMGQAVPWKSRTHFFGIAATMMRRILVDHARRATADRRDRGREVTLDPVASNETPASPDPVMDVLGVHEALTRLEQVDARQARLVELKFFVGLSIDEIAEMLEISPATVSREWAMGRAWLQDELRDACGTARRFCAFSEDA
jgi:RNA polymerase sigma factor (TIGR02999 family)